MSANKNPCVIEITPEMIEAGAMEVLGRLEERYGVYDGLAEMVAEDVLKAGLRLANKRAQKSA